MSSSLVAQQCFAKAGSNTTWPHDRPQRYVDLAFRPQHKKSQPARVQYQLEIPSPPHSRLQSDIRPEKLLLHTAAECSTDQQSPRQSIRNATPRIQLAGTYSKSIATKVAKTT
jgi:hypothetical protein